MATETVHHSAMTFSDHLPILQVLIPFITAPLIVFIGRRELAWPLAFIASLTSFLVASLLLSKVIGGEIISYKIGGWAPPLGIEYRVDAANAFVLFLVTAIATLVLPYARQSITAEIPQRSQTLFYTLFLLCLTGLLGVTTTADAFNVFVFLEISSLSTYVLIAQGSYRDKRALTAAFNYLIMGTIGATFFVIGIGFLYMATGTLNMADLADRIASQYDSRTVRAGFAFILVGVGLKVAIFPLHLWLPNAYTYAPSAVTTFLAATATKVAIYVLLRFVFSVFQPGFLNESPALEIVLYPFALLAMFAASFTAIFQRDLKRMLAYSSIAQVGYMLLGIALLSETGLMATIIHLFNHGITKAALFMGLGAYSLRSGGSFYIQLHGLGKTMPWTSAATVIGGLSLIGVPGTAGFLSKWLLVQAALEQGYWPLAVLIVASSLLAVIYVWRLVEVLYLSSPISKKVTKEAPISMLLPLWVMALACIYFGFDTDITFTAAKVSAEALLSGSSGMMD
ncbi:MAG: monovalent cation/H+ antiporter subunit D family protein [Planktomarina sp.]|nr:monovalent cation/H+ antiporter subunit D family protein [Planktomarina sp.]